MEQCTIWYEPDQSRVEEYCCTCRAAIWSHNRHNPCRSETELVPFPCYPYHRRSRCQMRSQQLRPGFRWHWHWLLIATLLLAVCTHAESVNTWRNLRKSSRRIDSASQSVRRLPVQHHNYSSVLLATNYGRTGRHTPPYNPSPYYNQQLMSIPYTNHQLVFQHQMLSQLVSSSSPNAPSQVNPNTPQQSNQIPRNIHRVDSNDLSSSASSPNMLKVKGSKWWDIGREPSEAMVTHMDGRHANAILPNKITSSMLSTMNLPLRKKQRRLVRDNPGVLSAISKAMRLAISECQYQFRDRRWNCPVNDWKKGKNVFGRIVQRGCRETAFIYALTSAAVAHSIAKACTEGQIETCTCDYKHNHRNDKELMSGIDWEWGGCSDNIKFGYKFSRDFVDAAERGRDFRFVMNLHNNDAGREHVKQKMRRECKCHGMSGSCTVKTCWMQLPSFREIGNVLKGRFDNASRISVSNDYRGITRKMFKRVPLKLYETGYVTPTENDLVYYEESPDFCTAVPKFGVMGTQGRICNASSIGVEGCNLLCCGRGHVTEEIEEFERCNCTFKWCCDVRCKICKNKRQISRCL